MPLTNSRVRASNTRCSCSSAQPERYGFCRHAENWIACVCVAFVRRSRQRAGARRQRLFRLFLLQHRFVVGWPSQYQRLGSFCGRKARPLPRNRRRFDSHYGSQNFVVSCLECGFSSSVNANVTAYNFLLGPRVSASVGKFRPFAEALFGGGHVSVNNGVGTDFSFATALGGGLDYKIIKPIAVRLQGDYVRTSFFGGTQDNVRISTGIVLRF